MRLYFTTLSTSPHFTINYMSLAHFPPSSSRSHCVYLLFSCRCAEHVSCLESYWFNDDSLVQFHTTYAVNGWRAHFCTSHTYLSAPLSRSHPSGVQHWQATGRSNPILSSAITSSHGSSVACTNPRFVSARQGHVQTPPQATTPRQPSLSSGGDDSIHDHNHWVI